LPYKDLFYYILN